VSCDPEKVTGFVDGELDAPGMAEMAAHLDSCEGCRAQAAAERELRARLRALPAPELPEGLAARVRSRVRRPASSVLARWVLPLAAVLVVGLWVRGWAPFVAWELARDHLHCFSRRPLPAQVRSGEPQVVSAWFETRGTALPAIPDEAGDARLVGGRYCILAGLTRAAHVYYVSPDGGLSVFLVPHYVRVDRSFADESHGMAVRLVHAGGSVVGIVGRTRSAVDAMEQALRPIVTASLEAPPPSP
jgi:anti-sigma factor RsiW